MIILLSIFIAYVIIANIWYRKKNANPYIKAHKRKWKNESDYQEYIKWLDGQGGDLPLKEVKPTADNEIINEINKQLNK